MGISYFRVDFVWKGSSQGRCERHYDDVLRCALRLLDTRWKPRRGDTTLLDPHVRPLRKISHDARGGCVQDLTIVWLGMERGRKFLRCAMGYIRGGEVGSLWEHQQQAIKSTTTSSPSSNSPIHFEQFERTNLLNNLKTTINMNNFDSHPRILSLSSASTPSSIPTTPSSQSRRQSHESAHDAHHFVNQEEKTQHKLNLSIKKMWEGVKKHAIEHHKSVNAAYMASYGCGAPSGTVTQGKPL
jgi:hypothetical protein